MRSVSDQRSHDPFIPADSWFRICEVICSVKEHFVSTEKISRFFFIQAGVNLHLTHFSPTWSNHCGSVERRPKLRLHATWNVFSRLAQAQCNGIEARLDTYCNGVKVSSKTTIFKETKGDLNKKTTIFYGLESYEVLKWRRNVVKPNFSIVYTRKSRRILLK